MMLMMINDPSRNIVANPMSVVQLTLSLYHPICRAMAAVPWLRIRHPAHFKALKFLLDDKIVND
jgi:hypothetical protein